MNILILSAGTRNKIIQYFKKTLKNCGRVVAADCSNIAPALYEADSYYIVPRITEPYYIDSVLDICDKERITGVLSLIDPELSLLALNADIFKQKGIMVIGSDYSACESTLNKWNMYQWLKRHGYNTAKTYIDLNDFCKSLDAGEISFPVFVKPICGSASIAITKADNLNTVKMLFENSKGLMVQEYMRGQEIGADCYIDMISGNVVSIFTKKKLAMRAGETDKAVSFKDKKLFKLITAFCTDFGFKGPIDIDVFDNNGEYYISEVNPRFGGGYPHAYECGADHMQLIYNNLNGKINKVNIGAYDDGVYMMKYNEVMVKGI